jgi:NADH dehydrogenase (ubiquinone) Fe-S protein 8
MSYTTTMLASRQLRRAVTNGAVVRRATAATPTTAMSLRRRTYATPSGPPPQGFRLPEVKGWEDDKESTLDKLGKYFLMTEMARGMYVLMEQFFRPP